MLSTACGKPSIFHLMYKPIIQTLSKLALLTVLFVFGLPIETKAQYKPPWPKYGDSLVTTGFWRPAANAKDEAVFFLKRPDEVWFEFKAFLQELGNGRNLKNKPDPSGFVAGYGTGFVRAGQPIRVSEFWFPLREHVQEALADDEFHRKYFKSYSGGTVAFSRRDMSRAQRGYHFGYWIEMPSEEKLKNIMKSLHAIDLKLKGDLPQGQRDKLEKEVLTLERKAYPALMAKWYELEREIWQQAHRPGEWIHPRKLPLYVPGNPWDSLETVDIFERMVLPAELDYRFQLKAVYVVDRNRKGKLVSTETHIRTFDNAAEPLKDFWKRTFGDDQAVRNLRFFRNELAIQVLEKKRIGKLFRETRTMYHLTRKDIISE